MASNTRLDYVKILLVKGDKGDKGDAGDGRELEARLEQEITDRERADTTLTGLIEGLDDDLDDLNDDLTAFENKLDVRSDIKQMIFTLNNSTQPAMFWKETDDTLWKVRYDTVSGKYLFEHYDGTTWTTLDPFATKQDALDSEAVEITVVPAGDASQTITENSVNVYRYGKVVEVDMITSIAGFQNNLAQLAYGLPEPLRTVRFEAITRSSAYSQPLSITIQNPNSVWALCCQYGDANATAQNPTRYYAHFTYIAK